MIPRSLMMTVEMIFMVITSLIFTGALLYYFLLIIPFFAYILYYIGTKYITCSRELKRIESIYNSTNMMNLSECVNGYLIIRNFGYEKVFKDYFTESMNNSMKANYNM